MQPRARTTDTGTVASGGEVVQWVGRSAKRIAIAVIGGLLILAGLVLMVLPGPGLLLVIAGLAVLASEFAWASSALAMAKRKAGDAGSVVTRRLWRRGGPSRRQGPD